MHALHTKSSKHISQCCGRTLCPNIPILRAPAQISLQCKLLNTVWLWPPAKCFKTYLSTYDGECTIKIHHHHQYHSYQASTPKCSLFIIKGIMNILLGPIYRVRLCRMRQAYDRLTTQIVSCKSNLQLAYDS